MFDISGYMNTGDFRNNAMKLEQYISLKKLLQPIKELSHLLIVTPITFLLRTTHTDNFKKQSYYYESPLQRHLLSFLVIIEELWRLFLPSAIQYQVLNTASFFSLPELRHFKYNI